VNWFRPCVLPYFPAQPRPTSSLSVRPSRTELVCFSSLQNWSAFRTGPIRPSLADRWAHPVSEPRVIIRTCPFCKTCPIRPLRPQAIARTLGPLGLSSLGVLPKGASSSSMRSPAMTLSQSHVTAMWGLPVSSIPLPAPADPNPVATSGES
jgi:hypothetical protein